MASLLEKLSKESPSNLKKRSIESMNWFRSNARLIKTTPQAWQRNIDEFRDKFELGKMYMFFYDAKHKKTLPYWDRFPVMIPVER